MTSSKACAWKKIKNLKDKNLDIKFLAIGGENIKSEKIDCIFDVKDIAYMGFIDVLKNIFSIKANSIICWSSAIRT